MFSYQQGWIPCAFTSSSRPCIALCKGFFIEARQLPIELLTIIFGNHQLKLQFIISGKTHYENQYYYYKKYLSHLAQTQPMSAQEAFESPYYDYLQSPLQPLMDNLESQTYEVFEKDPVKYKNYQEAVRLALLERLDKPITLMVLGAGRGPLVTAALNATTEANHKRVNIYAVEKNPNAVVTYVTRLLSTCSIIVSLF